MQFFFFIIVQSDTAKMEFSTYRFSMDEIDTTIRLILDTFILSSWQCTIINSASLNNKLYKDQ